MRKTSERFNYAPRRIGLVFKAIERVKANSLHGRRAPKRLLNARGLVRKTGGWRINPRAICRSASQAGMPFLFVILVSAPYGCP
jgi:hypothetical protein